MSGCGTVVHSRTIRMVRSVGVFSGGCVMVMGIVGVTTLHPHGMGRPELPSYSWFYHPCRWIP
jgi:hypothetical protein